MPAVLATLCAAAYANTFRVPFIFDDFFTTRTHGAGIGLAVVRRIVDDHAPMGVKLTVDEPSGGGASFRVTLSRDVSGLRRSLRPPTNAGNPAE